MAVEDSQPTRDRAGAPPAHGQRVAEDLLDTDEDPQQVDREVALQSLNQWQLAWRRFRKHRMAFVGLGILIFLVAVVIVVPIFQPFNFLNIPGSPRPGGEPPRLDRIFGTTYEGRDVFTLVANGGRVSLVVGLMSMVIAGSIGVVVGSIAGFMGGMIDNILMRIVDVFFAIPFLFVILVAARFFGRGDVLSLVLIIGLLSWPLIARLVRASFLSLREADFVDAARAVGVSNMRIAFRHILPNALSPVIVACTLLVANAIVLEAFVSFLGFGIRETEVSWGNALANAQEGIRFGNWWWAFFPGMAIALTVLSINFIGDGLRDALDPRSRD
ncbi:MAG TPA: ABC transporter permease [Candidatus Limnocylindrales bacterium]|nr:ABC transporter permease [Candidatus Limnocylindrales bacterium]